MLLVTGGTGFFGRRLSWELLRNHVEYVPIGSSCDLRDYANAKRIMEILKPDAIVHLAAKVGGIGANMHAPYTFLADNLKINMNVVTAALELKVPRLLAIGSVCMYPKMTPIPFKEEDIWKGYPEDTNSPYGISKRVLLELCRIAGYKMVIPTNLYGPGADDDLTTSHVIPAIIRKCIAADKNNSSLKIWGTGKATRDFLYVNDAAKGIASALQNYDTIPPEVNLATGAEVRISTIVKHVCDIVGFKGGVEYDITKPDGQPRRCVDVTKAMHYLNWRPETELADGLRETVAWAQQHMNKQG